MPCVDFTQTHSQPGARSFAYPSVPEVAKTFRQSGARSLAYPSVPEVAKTFRQSGARSLAYPSVPAVATARAVTTGAHRYSSNASCPCIRIVTLTLTSPAGAVPPYIHHHTNGNFTRTSIFVTPAAQAAGVVAGTAGGDSSRYRYHGN